MQGYEIKEIQKKLGAFIKTNPIISERSTKGDAVRNQYELQYENGTAFQSYETLIAIRVGGKLYFTKHHACSKTTSKYCSQWCGYSPEERKKGLKSGQFGSLVDSLND